MAKKIVNKYAKPQQKLLNLQVLTPFWKDCDQDRKMSKSQTKSV